MTSGKIVANGVNVLGKLNCWSMNRQDSYTGTLCVDLKYLIS